MSGDYIKSWKIGATRIDLYTDGINTSITDVGDTFAWPAGWPDVESSYQDHARELGYGDRVMLMCQEHEAAHTLLAHLVGLPYSGVLYGIITGQTYPEWGDEESAVLSLQRYCRINSISILHLLDRYQEEK
jgi:hypothetical protein